MCAERMRTVRPWMLLREAAPVWGGRGCFVLAPKKLVRFLEANWLKLVIFAAIGVAIIWAALPRRKVFKERRPPADEPSG